MDTTTDLHADLRTRWVPGPDQINAAEALLAEHPELEYVYTIHLLVNKTFGIWTEDVRVVNTDPDVFIERVEAWRTLNTRAHAYSEMTDTVKITGGYTIHRPQGSWAVFEDIGTVIA